MIRPLRRRHLWLVAAVTAITVPLYLAALAARPAPVPASDLPPALAAPPAASGPAVELTSSPVLRARAMQGGRAVQLELEGAFESPAPLLYWVPGGEGLDGGRLLGAVGGDRRQRFELPAAADGPGFLVVYSLGHGAELARAAWPPAVGEAR